MPSRVEHSIEIDRDVTTVYNQWTQFEEFPNFMEGVERVEQRDDAHLHWAASIGGVTREWDAEIVRQEPDQIVEWQAIGDTRNDGRVTFEDIGPERTRVNLALEFEPESFAEKVGDALNIIDRRAQGDLERFKKFIEERGTETGAWREDIT